MDLDPDFDLLRVCGVYMHVCVCVCVCVVCMCACVACKSRRGSRNFGGAKILKIVGSLFRVVKTTLSSSYNISGLVPACWLLFQCC